MAPMRLAQELCVSPKTLRAFLRRRFPRDSSDVGTRWVLNAEHIAAARQKFRSRNRPAGNPAPINARSAAAPSAPAVQSVGTAPLRCYVRPALDVLFVALNPPGQSANNRHWFSGNQSAFFKLLYRSGLITADLAKATADELVFGSAQFNHKGADYGVTDLRPDFVEVNSAKVLLHDSDVERFIRCVRDNKPRLVCIMHSKVRDAFNGLLGRNAGVVDVTRIGKFTQPLAKCASRFICNYFPNGNAVSDQVKIDIFRLVRDAI